MTQEFPEENKTEQTPPMLEEIQSGAVPEHVMVWIRHSILFDDPLEQWGKPQLYTIHFTNGDISYAFTGKAPIGRAEGIVGGVIDTRGKAVVGEARFALLTEPTKEHLIGKPRVSYSESFHGYKGQGLHRRRLEIMNALSIKATDLPLHSDVYKDRQPAASSAWKHLKDDGKAVEYEEAGLGKRFRFKVPNEP